MELEEKRLNEEQRELEMDTIALSQIGQHLLHDLIVELEDLEYDEEDFQTLTRLKHGYYTPCLGRAVSALSESVKERMGRIKRLQARPMPPAE